MNSNGYRNHECKNRLRKPCCVHMSIEAQIRKIESTSDKLTLKEIYHTVTGQFHSMAEKKFIHQVQPLKGEHVISEAGVETHGGHIHFRWESNLEQMLDRFSYPIILSFITNFITSLLLIDKLSFFFSTHWGLSEWQEWRRSNIS